MLQSAIKSTAFALNEVHSVSVLGSDETSNEPLCSFSLFGSNKQKTYASGKKVWRLYHVAESIPLNGTFSGFWIEN